MPTEQELIEKIHALEHENMDLKDKNKVLEKSLAVEKRMKEAAQADLAEQGETNG